MVWCTCWIVFVCTREMIIFLSCFCVHLMHRNVKKINRWGYKFFFVIFIAYYFAPSLLFVPALIDFWPLGSSISCELSTDTLSPCKVVMMSVSVNSFLVLHQQQQMWSMYFWLNTDRWCILIVCSRNINTIWPFSSTVMKGQI